MDKKHTFFYRFLRLPVILFLKLRFGYRYEKARDLPQQYIVLSNHATDYDMLFVAAGFPKPMYFLGSEHIARWGLLSKLIRFAFDPIMRPKGASAVAAVKELLRRVRGGANVCMFPEGVRTWDGVTCPIPPSTAKLIRSAGCGLVTYKLEGGYFASPMWGGASVRRGPVYGHPVHIYTPAQISAMSSQQLQQAIEADLFEDAYKRQNAQMHPYRSKKAAEKLENLLFICPKCLAQDAFQSKGNTVGCACGLQLRYDAFGMLHDAPFRTLKEFSDWQKQQVAAHVAAGETYRACAGELYTVQAHAREAAADGPVAMGPDGLRCGDFAVPLESVTDLAMHGQKTIVFTACGKYYELILPPQHNVLRFWLYYLEIKKRS